MLLLKAISALLVGLLFSQDNSTFFKNIQKYPPSKQETILEKRIRFFVARERGENYQKTVEAYLRVGDSSKRLSHRLDFLNGVLRFAKKKSKVRPVADAASQFCAEIPEDCLKEIESFKKLLEGSKSTELGFVFLNNVMFSHIDVYSQKTKALNAFFQPQYFPKEKKAEVFKKAVALLFVDSAKKILPQLKGKDLQDRRVKFSVCALNFLDNQLDKASSCYSKVGGEWGDMFAFYVKRVKQGGKANPPKDLKVKMAKLVSGDPKPYTSFLVSMNLLIFNDPLRKMESGLLSEAGKNYLNGYLMLVANRKLKKMKPSDVKILEGAYLKNHKGTELAKAYKSGKLSSALDGFIPSNHYIKTFQK